MDAGKLFYLDARDTSQSILKRIDRQTGQAFIRLHSPLMSKNAVHQAENTKGILKDGAPTKIWRFSGQSDG